jgi:tRNA pseudouridine(55) synthase
MGFVNVNKPSGARCGSLLKTVKQALGVSKVGWCGTLDPLGRGVLPVAFGRATRTIGALPAGWKVYDATILVGAGSVTDDVDSSVVWTTAEGVPLAHEERLAAFLPERSTLHGRPVCDIGAQELQDLVAGVVGVVQQRPPLASSVKVGGKRAHALARQGELHASQLPLRTQLVHSAQLLSWTPRVGASTLELLSLPADEAMDSVFNRTRGVRLLEQRGGLQHCGELSIRVRCSAGTYIRSLARDLGFALGHPACILSLTRVESMGMVQSQGWDPWEQPFSTGWIEDPLSVLQRAGAVCVPESSLDASTVAIDSKSQFHGQILWALASHAEKDSLHVPMVIPGVGAGVCIAPADPWRRAVPDPQAALLWGIDHSELEASVPPECYHDIPFALRYPVER